MTVNKCTNCGGELRFSHRKYAGRGASMLVFRCVSCGSENRSEARTDENVNKPARKSKRPLPQEGSPDNRVIDAQTAALLRGLFDEPDESPGT